MTPQRVRLSRKAGARMPPNSVAVTRGPGRIFGNPFTLKAAHEAGYKTYAAADAVRDFRTWLTGSHEVWTGPQSEVARAAILGNLHRLRGKNLACFCKLDAPCHADVLLELANAAG